MDLVDVAVLALRLALVLVLYAFLVVVLRSATRGVLGPAADPETGARQTRSAIPSSAARRRPRPAEEEPSPSPNPNLGLGPSPVPRPSAGPEPGPSRNPSASARALRLLVLEAGRSNLIAGATLDVDETTIVGRQQRPGVCTVSDPAISAQHLRLARGEAGWVASDLGSTNGTTLNGRLLEGDVVLAAGDVLGLGSVRLQVLGD